MAGFHEEPSLSQHLQKPLATEEGEGRKFLIGSFALSVLCLACIAWLRSAFPDLSFRIFWHLLFSQDYWGAWLTLGILAVALPARNAAPVLLVVRALAGHPGKVAAVAFVALGAGAYLAYHHHPLSMDEYSASFQGAVFAGGHLTGQFPAPLVDWLVPRMFQDHFLVVSHQTGQVVSAYWPGFAILLTPFTFLGIPWACNPALGALSLLALHRIAGEVAGNEEAGGWALLFALASPAFAINAMSFYSMTAHLLLNLVYTLLLLRPTPAKAFVAGLAGGLALVLHNPFPHLLYALPWIVWLMMRRDFRSLGALAAGYLPGAIGMGLGWIALKAGLRDAALFGNAASAAAADSAWQILINHLRVFALPDLLMLVVRLAGTMKLWVWTMPGLLLLAWFGFRAGREDPRCRLLLASAGLTYIGFFFIPVDQGHGWGYRYFHSALGVLPILAAIAMVRGTAATRPARRLAAMAGYVAIASLVFSTALRVNQVEAFVDGHLRQVPLPEVGKLQIAFIDIRQGYYTADLVQNHPRLEGRRIVMVSHGPERNAEVAKQLAPAARRASAGAWGELWLVE